MPIVVSTAVLINSQYQQQEPRSYRHRNEHDHEFVQESDSSSTVDCSSGSQKVPVVEPCCRRSMHRIQDPQRLACRNILPLLERSLAMGDLQESVGPNETGSDSRGLGCFSWEHCLFPRQRRDDGEVSCDCHRLRRPYTGG